jgi:hypothetical protein
MLLIGFAVRTICWQVQEFPPRFESAAGSLLRKSLRLHSLGRFGLLCDNAALFGGGSICNRGVLGR